MKGFNCTRTSIRLSQAYPVASWAHARRKFAEAITALKKGKRGGKASTAGIALKQISELYKLEKEALQQNLHGEARVAFYEEKSEPILEKLRKLLENTQPKTPPNSKLGEAIKYTLKLWPRLSRCFKQGNARLDTNLVENAIRPIAVGRKNWMQAGSPAGAEASTIWFSIIETAKASGWEPYAYLRFLFDRLPNTPRENLRDLLPYVAQPTT